MDADVVVVGAGAVGTSTALHLALSGRSVIVVEKESEPGIHQSTRNSGVIHAGYNAKPGTLKAEFCVQGNRDLRAYCRARGVRVDDNGILVVARNDDEVRVLQELRTRAAGNGVSVRLVDEAGLKDLEPHAAGTAALHAPDGSSFDARGYMDALARDAEQAGVRFLYGRTAKEIEEPGGRPVTVRMAGGVLEAKAAINCAGLHADRLAAALSPDLRVVPFRGFYAELVPPRRFLVRGHIYAAPDLAYPFLGAHFSRRFDGRVLVGPGAMLAFGREAYRFHQFRARDLADTLLWPGFYRLLARPGFGSLVTQEVLKSLSLRYIWQEAHDLVPELRPRDLVGSFAGNRAQLVSREGKLVEDIVVRETPRSLHVLNAVSPGLTCSLPFGKFLAGRCNDLRVWS